MSPHQINQYWPHVFSFTIQFYPKSRHIVLLGPGRDKNLSEKWEYPSKKHKDR